MIGNIFKPDKDGKSMAGNMMSSFMKSLSGIGSSSSEQLLVTIFLTIIDPFLVSVKYRCVFSNFLIKKVLQTKENIVNYGCFYNSFIVPLLIPDSLAIFNIFCDHEMLSKQNGYNNKHSCKQQYIQGIGIKRELIINRQHSIKSVVIKRPS